MISNNIYNITNNFSIKLLCCQPIIFANNKSKIYFLWWRIFVMHIYLISTLGWFKKTTLSWMLYHLILMTRQKLSIKACKKCYCFVDDKNISKCLFSGIFMLRNQNVHRVARFSTQNNEFHKTRAIIFKRATHTYRERYVSIDDIMTTLPLRLLIHVSVYSPL